MNTNQKKLNLNIPEVENEIEIRPITFQGVPNYCICTVTLLTELASDNLHAEPKSASLI